MGQRGSQNAQFPQRGTEREVAQAVLQHEGLQGARGRLGGGREPACLHSGGGQVQPLKPHAPQRGQPGKSGRQLHLQSRCRTHIAVEKASRFLCMIDCQRLLSMRQRSSIQR